MSSPKKILVIRLKQIGDALLSLPVCNSLRATYPDAQIDYLVYKHITPILANQPSIDKLLVITPEERKNKLAYFKKVWSIRQEKYDMVIDLINVPISAITTAVSGAEHTIGFDKKRLRAKLYKTAVVHRHRGDTLTKKLDILQGLPTNAVVDRTWNIPVSTDARAEVKKTMQGRGVNFDQPIVFIAASSRRTDKLWPEDFMVETIEHLQNKHNAQIVFNWVPGPEGQLVSQIVKKLTSIEGVFPDIDLSLSQLPVAISLCDFFFGNDGGPNHMAIGTGVPSLAIFAPFHLKEVWLPVDDLQHQGIDIKGAMQLDHAGFSAIEKDIKANLADYYMKLTPAMAVTKIDEMLGTVERFKEEVTSEQ